MPRTRFVCVSDTHGYTPSEAGFKLPAGDVLIHAGDLTNQGNEAEIRRTIDWISKADYEMKIIVAGNHDITLDPRTDTSHSHSIPNQPPKYLDLLPSSPQVIYLTHQAAVIRLTRPGGPKTIFKIFGSPYSPRISSTWAAFGYEADDAERLWSQVPLDADIVVTHTPPHSHLDSRGGQRTGCKALNRALKRVRPCLAVSGHVHEARGVERVRWEVGSEKTNEDVESVALPASRSKKQSLVDLTGRKGKRLDNCGLGSKSTGVTFFPEHNAMVLPSANEKAGHTLEGSGPNQQVSSANIPYQEYDEYSRHQSLRRETCVVNASIMATSWPYHGGKKFNAPVVVDLDLPTTESNETAVEIGRQI